MSEPTNIRRLDQRPLQEAISTRGRSFIPGLTKDDLIKYFFGGNAWISMIVLGLIMLSLFSQSIGFNPFSGFFGQDYRNQLVYRQAGLEFVDIIKKEASDLDDLGQYLSAARLHELKRLLAQGKSQGKTEDQSLADANATLASFDEYAGRLSGFSDGLDNIISDLGDTAKSTKSQLKTLEDKKAEKQLYLSVGKKEMADKVTYQEVDLAAAIKPLKDAIPSIHDANAKLATDLTGLISQPPPVVDENMKSHVAGFESRPASGTRPTGTRKTH